MIVEQIYNPSPTLLSRELQTAELVTMTKIPKYPRLCAGYTDGTVKVMNTLQQQTLEQLFFYKNGQVIDLKVMDQSIVTCSHSGITVHNLQKNKAMILKGHESTPFFLACHPVSPLVLSCSETLILHDLRLGKPVNVNFITPPAYSLQYFPDGQFFVLGGEPVRVGNSQWVRTLLNGLAQPSLSGKYVLTNPMNGRISLWDWRESEEVLSWEVKNQNIYQMPFFGMVRGKTRKALFFDDECVFHSFDILSERKEEMSLKFIEDSKVYIDKMEQDTTEFYRYSVNGVIQRYDLEL